MAKKITKILKKLEKQGRNKPAAVSRKLRKISLFVILFWLVMVCTAMTMLVMKFKTPGLAWLW